MIDGRTAHEIGFLVNSFKASLEKRENKYTVVTGCHASGKEWTAGSVAVWAAYCCKMLVLIVSAPGNLNLPNDYSTESYMVATSP